MGAVTVHLDALDVLRIHIAADMIPPVNDQDGLARRPDLLGKGRAEQPCAHDEILVMRCSAVARRNSLFLSDECDCFLEINYKITGNFCQDSPDFPLRSAKTAV